MAQDHPREMIGSGRERGPGRVLVIMDQPLLVEVIRLALNHGRFTLQVARDADAASVALDAWQPHLVIVDMDVNDGGLLATLPARAGAQGRLPAIALTRRGDLQTKLDAFEQGADDILTVPFSPEELVARVLALMRRTYSEAVAFTPVVRVGELEIDLLHRQVRAGTAELHLTSVEQSLLYLLAANAGRLLTRDEILDSLWGVDFVAESNLVDRHIRNLRAKLQDNWQRPRFIATVPGRGYRFLPSAVSERSAGVSPVATSAL